VVINNRIYQLLAETSRSMNIGYDAARDDWYGMQHFNTANPLHAMAKQSLANCTDFVWKVCGGIQKGLMKPSLGGTAGRDEVYGKRL
jgi:hypothetical protein